jgi:flagellar biosynthesis chaperone FliJ
LLVARRFEKLKEENNMIRTLREEIRNLKDNQVEFEEKLKLVRKGKGDAEELLMSPEDKEEMEENIKRLRRQVRMFQRAIKKCRDKWQEMKNEGKIPESAGAKKLRETLLAKKTLNAFGGGGGAGGLIAALKAGAGVEEERKQAEATKVVKILQFGFGSFGGPGGGLGIGGVGAGGKGAGGKGGNSPKGGSVGRKLNRKLAENVMGGGLGGLGIGDMSKSLPDGTRQSMREVVDEVRIGGGGNQGCRGGAASRRGSRRPRGKLRRALAAWRARGCSGRGGGGGARWAPRRSPGGGQHSSRRDEGRAGWGWVGSPGNNTREGLFFVTNSHLKDGI